MFFVINYFPIMRRTSAVEETNIPCFFKRSFVFDLDHRLAIK